MYLTINELLSEVARLTEHLTFSDGRVAEALNERNVRYYVTLGVVRPAIREGNKSYYTQDHVLDLVRVRRAQHEGLSLKLIGRPIVNRAESQHTMPAWRTANSPALRNAALAPMGSYLSDTKEVGWMIRITETILLSGFGAAPDDAEIADVKHALRRHNANSPESETINPTKEENQ
jgi:DNA-binding transcriptional MerR regulator